MKELNLTGPMPEAQRSGSGFVPVLIWAPPLVEPPETSKVVVPQWFCSGLPVYTGREQCPCRWLDP
jgi:hypothetical protein